MEQNDQNQYDDIIYMQHHVSKVHPHMDALNRAAQFAPFAALSGYDDAINETGRLTDEAAFLDENIKDILDEKLRLIVDEKNMNKEVLITYFVPDIKKNGGRYKSVTGTLKKLDFARQMLILTNGEEIPIKNIYGLDF